MTNLVFILLYFFRFISNVFINIHEYANYITCILVNYLQVPCPSIYLVPDLVV